MLLFNTEINSYFIIIIKQEDTFVPNINATRGVDLVSYIKIWEIKGFSLGF